MARQHKCGTVAQGYGSHTTTDCLSHTGFDLTLLTVGAFAVLACGLLLRLVSRPRRARQRRQRREYRAQAGDWAAGLRPFPSEGLRTFHEAGAPERGHAHEDGP